MQEAGARVGAGREVLEVAGSGGIAVDAGVAAVAAERLLERRGVATCSEGGVDDCVTGLQVEQLGYLRC